MSNDVTPAYRKAPHVYTAAGLPTEPVIRVLPQALPTRQGRFLINTGPSSWGFHYHESYLRCPQLWAYTHLLGLSFEPSDPLIKGTLAHVGVAHVHARRMALQNGNDPEQFYTPADAIALAVEENETRGGDWRKWTALIQACVGSYEEATLSEIHTHRVIGVEVQLETLFVDPGTGEQFPYTQRLDVGLQDVATGGVIYIDTKTAAGALSNASTDRAHAMSGQFHGLQTFGRLFHGQAFQGCAINYLGVGREAGKHRIRPLPVAEWAWARFPMNIVAARREIAFLRQQGADPWSYKMAMSELVCEHRYGACSAMQLCLHGPEALKHLNEPTAREWRSGRA